MQQIKTGIITTAWIFGLLVAGSDSPQMPWVNFLGLFLFAAASMGLGRRLHPSTDPDEQPSARRVFPRAPRVNRRMHARYGLNA